MQMPWMLLVIFEPKFKVHELELIDSYLVSSSASVIHALKHKEDKQYDTENMWPFTQVNPHNLTAFRTQRSKSFGACGM
jgi:hypothetical protein